MPENKAQSRTFDPALLAGAALLCALVFAVDLSQRLSPADGVLYVALACFGWFFRRLRQIVLLGAVASVLAVAGLLTAPDGGAGWAVPASRGLALVAIWAAVAVVIAGKRASVSLELEIAERERTEQRIREREAHFKHAQAMARLGTFVWDETTNTCLYCSEELAHLRGMSVAEYMEKRGNHEAAVASVYPDDRARYRQVVDTAARDLAAYDVEFRGFDEHGNLRYWREMGEPEVDEDGELLRTFGTVQDITDIKRAESALRDSEEQFRNLIEGSIQGVLIHRDGKLLFANQALADMFGYRDPDEVLALPSIQELEAEHEHDRLAAYDLARRQGGDAPTRYEFEGVRRDGTGIWIENFVTIATWNGEPAVQSTCVNITERKQAQDALKSSEEALHERVAELEETRRRLEEQGADLVRVAGELKIAHARAEAANRAKSEFLANMSHELRTPLNAIIGFSEIIKDQAFGPAGSEKYCGYAEDICHSGQHLLSLINDILDLSKVESGATDLQEDDLEVQSIIDSSLRLVRERARKNGVRLSLEVEEGLPFIRADDRKLKQILVNLLTNAIKFTSLGGTVTLKAWCRPDSGVVFQVIDTGIGMAPEDIPKALSQFGQIDSDLNRKYEGTGLGLPLSKSLIELHGGSLDLQSQPDVGTTVTVRLPAVRIVRAKDAEERSGESQQAAS